MFFAYDSDALDDTARTTMAANAEVLKKYGTWVITVEGHCDERGTAEYNLALGDRRALAVKNYMVSLGISGRPPEDRQLRQRVSVRARATTSSRGRRTAGRISC